MTVGGQGCIVFGRVRVGGEIGDFYARTSTRIRRHADEKCKKQNQKIRRQTNLRMVVNYSASTLFVSARYRIPVSTCLHTVSAYPRASPFYSDPIYS